MDYAIAATYRTISSSYNSVGNYEKAIQYLSHALELFKQLNGEMHNDTASTKYLLAQIYQGHGEYEKAARLKNEAIDCVEKLGYLEISKRWREESL